MAWLFPITLAIVVHDVSASCVALTRCPLELGNSLDWMEVVSVIIVPLDFSLLVMVVNSE